MKSYFGIYNGVVRYRFEYHDYGLMIINMGLQPTDDHHEFLVPRPLISEANRLIMMDNGLTGLSLYFEASELSKSFVGGLPNEKYLTYLDYYKDRLITLKELYQTDIMFAYSTHFDERVRYVMSFNDRETFDNALLISKLTDDNLKRMVTVGRK